MNIPPKVIFFIWRLCNNAIPIAGGLDKRVNTISPMCFRFGVEVESEVHAILSCQFAMNVWEVLCFEYLMERDSFNTIFGLDKLGC